MLRKSLLSVASGFCALLLVLSLPACNSSSDKALFQKLDASTTGIEFSNELQYSDSLTVLDFEYMFNGAGVAFIDINNDGLQDLFFSGNMVSSRLYLNKGNMKFEDITKTAGIATKGWTYGVSIVDINQDGFADIYLSKAGNRKTRPEEMENQFFINNRNNTFTDRAASMKLNSNGYDIHAAFFDYDRDGDLDMYLLRNAFVSYNRNTARAKLTDGSAPSNDRLFRNDGNLIFTDVSREAGIIIEGFGLGVSICDLNNDDWPDVYVSNDFLTNDLAWINNHDGTFTNKAGTMMKHETYNGMGNDVADYNNDGLEDVIVVDMLPPDNKRWKLTMRGNTYEEFQNALSYGYEPQYVRNTLQLNNGDGTFSEIGQLAGVHATEWSWAPLLADYDNDGYKDLFVSNGYRQDITNLDFIRYGKRANFVGTPEANRAERLKQLRKYPGIEIHNYLYKNNRDLTFKDVSEDWGMTDAAYSNGAAFGDLDNDGDLDLVTNNLDGKPGIYQNKTEKISPNNGWLRISLQGQEGNRQGLGSKLWVWQKGGLQYQYFTPYRGYLSTTESIVHFGLSDAPIDSLKILWPDGSVQELKNIPGKQQLVLKQADAKKNSSIPQPENRVPNYFTEVPGLVSYKHSEDDYVDFKLQPLLPKNYSKDGPGLAVGDINGDAIEDFFIGSAAGKAGTFFLQDAAGRFHQQLLPDSNTSDNMGALLFDADNDNDNDLYLPGGGTLVNKKNDTVYQHHIYINDSKGTFTKASNALDGIIGSGSSVIAADFDRDGDLDIFVCGRINPGEYPTEPRSFLLRNDSQPGAIQFTDVASQQSTNLSHTGMISSALWTDFNNDGWVDLITVGEYMAIRFYQNVKGKLNEITETTGLSHTNGWWNSLSAGDFDNDGDIDYVAGNLGLNSPYLASSTEPVCVYANDYDKDGRLDPVLCHFVDGVEQVYHARDDMNRQMTPFRARFRTYESYASVNFKEAFREEEITKARVFRAERFSSSYIENLGNGKFRISDLPLTAQFSPIYGMLTEDVDEDGNLDVIVTGNSYSTEVQTGRYDAQGSFILKGNGHGSFTVERNQLNVQQDNKSVVRLVDKQRDLYLIASNSDSLRIFSKPAKHKTVSVLPNESVAIINLPGGKTLRRELNYGSSYLSQSSRILQVPSAATSVSIFSYTGRQRVVKF